MKKFAIGVFPEPGKRKWKFSAYTIWYNPKWKGCQIVKITAENGIEAKKKAIQFMRKKLENVPFQELKNQTHIFKNDPIS